MQCVVTLLGQTQQEQPTGCNLTNFSQKRGRNSKKRGMQFSGKRFIPSHSMLIQTVPFCDSAIASDNGPVEETKNCTEGNVEKPAHSP